MRKSWKSPDKAPRKSWVIYKNVMRKSWDSHEKVMRKSHETYEIVLRKSWDSHEKVLRKSRDIFKKVLWKSCECLQLYFSCRLCIHVFSCLFSPNLSDLRCHKKKREALPFRQNAMVKVAQNSLLNFPFCLNTIKPNNSNRCDPQKGLLPPPYILRTRCSGGCPTNSFVI